MEEEDEGGRLNGEGVTDPCPNQVKERWPTVASEGANETSVRVFFLFFSPFFLVRPLFWLGVYPVNG